MRSCGIAGDQLENAMNRELYQYMKNYGYKLFAKTYNTLIFCDGVA
jgi:hypothetical protein